MCGPGTVLRLPVAVIGRERLAWPQRWRRPARISPAGRRLVRVPTGARWTMAKVARLGPLSPAMASVPGLASLAGPGPALPALGRTGFRWLKPRPAAGHAAVASVATSAWWDGGGFELLVDLAGALPGGGEFARPVGTVFRGWRWRGRSRCGHARCRRGPSSCSLRGGQPVLQPGDQGERDRLSASSLAGEGQFGHRARHRGPGSR